MLEPNVGMGGAYPIVGRVAVTGAFVAELAAGRCPRRGRETDREN